MSDESAITIVVPTLGRRLDWLRTTLRSVATQAVPLDLKVVGPDSTDIRKLAEEFGGSLIVETGSSLSEALNQGLDGVTTPFFGWIADDDVLAPGSLTATANALRQKPNCPFVFGHVRYIDAEGSTKWLLRTGKWAVRYSHYGVNLIAQPGALFRTTMLIESGGLDNTLANAMDHELFLRLSSLGQPTYLRQELAAFRVHPGSISVQKSDQSESDDVRAMYNNGVDPRSNAIRHYTIKAANRVLLSTLSRQPSPPLPKIDSMVYTRQR